MKNPWVLLICTIYSVGWAPLTYATTYQITQVIDNNVQNGQYQPEGSRIVWSEFDGADDEVILFDGTSTTRFDLLP